MHHRRVFSFLFFSVKRWKALRSHFFFAKEQAMELYKWGQTLQMLLLITIKSRKWQYRLRNREVNNANIFSIINAYVIPLSMEKKYLRKLKLYLALKLYYFCVDFWVIVFRLITQNYRFKEHLQQLECVLLLFSLYFYKLLNFKS